MYDKLKHLNKVLTDFNNIFTNYSWAEVDSVMFKVVYVYSDILNEFVEYHDIEDYVKLKYEEVMNILMLIDKINNNLSNHPSLFRAKIDKSKVIRKLLL